MATGGGSGTPDAAAPPVSGASIDINGAKVPKEKAVVFIQFGHSNMAGRAKAPASETAYHYTVQPRLWTYQGAGKFVPAKEPTAPDNSADQGAGPGMAWLRAAAALAGPDHHFISIARAKGSAPSTDFLKGGLYYASFADKAKELKGKVTFGGVFIMLGITDRHLPLADQPGFTDRIARTMADLRADLGEPNLPLLASDYEVESTGSLGVNSEIGKRLRALVLALPAKITNCAIIPTDKIAMMDDHHFSMLGHHQWSDRGVALMKEKGWFFWGK